MRRGLPVDGRVEGQDQFGLRAEPRDEANYVEFVRADAVERREGAAQHMVAPAERAGALQGPQIGEVLDDADRVRIALGVAADRTGVGRIEVAASGASADRPGSGGGGR